jgi:hypothetical protein
MQPYKTLLIIIGIVFNLNTYAGNDLEDLNEDFVVAENTIVKPDLKIGVMGKLVPIQGVGFIEGGLSIIIWGDEKSGTPLYGYIRLAARYTTAGILNRGEVRLEAYPVSFAGIVASASVTDRGQEPLRFEKLDCTKVSCKGVLNRLGIGTDISLAIGNIFILPNIKFEKLHADTGLESFADEESNLRATTKTDHLVTSSIYVGQKVTESFLFGAYYKHQQMLGSHDNNDEAAMFFQYKNGAMTYAAMAGFYGDSIFNEQNFTMGFSIIYTPVKSVGL